MTLYLHCPSCGRVSQVAALSIERGALWHCVHGGLAAHGSVAAPALDEELVVFSWLRLQRTVANLLRDLPAHVADSAGGHRSVQHIACTPSQQ